MIPQKPAKSLPRVRFTLGRVMIALAILSALEYYVARLAILAASDDDGYFTRIDAFSMWIRLHIPIAFVAFMLWVAYTGSGRPARPDASEGSARDELFE